jgi:peroxiredoxin
MVVLILAVFFLIVSCTESVYDLTLEDLEGREVPLSLYRSGTLVVYLWSGTCVGHTEDLRSLTEVAPSLKGRANLITVAVMMDAREVLKVLRDNRIEPNYPVLVDPEGRFARKVPLVFLPATMVFDKRGLLEKSYPGLPPDLISFISPHQ